MNGIKRIFTSLVLAAGVMLAQSVMADSNAPVDLKSCSNFVILAGAGITIAATGPTTLNGDVGTHPTLSITGLENLTLNGVNHAGDAVTQNAKNDLVTAYDDAAGRSATTAYGPIYDLGGLTLTSGVYHGSSSFGVTGTLTLDAQGQPDAVWIFQAVSTLIAESGSRVVLTNGAQAGNIFWQVGSSATLKTDTVFKGTIMALESITIDAGSIMDGRALARNGAVTLDALVGGLPIAIRLSVFVSPSTWAAGVAGAGTVQMSSSGNKISVSNDGNVAETFTLTISDDDDQNEWTHSPSKSGAGTNIYVLSGIFCAGADSPAEGSFNQTASEDVLIATEQNATAAQFAYAEGTATGVAVPAGAGRSLWLRLDMPTAGTGGIEHKITVRVGCFQP